MSTAVGDPHADEVHRARMTQLERPETFSSATVVGLTIAIVEAKIAYAMSVWRGQASGSDRDAREQLADAACWVLELADLGTNGPDEVADALEAAARARINAVSKFAKKRGPKAKAKAAPRKRGRKPKASPADAADFEGPFVAPRSARLAGWFGSLG